MDSLFHMSKIARTSAKLDQMFLRWQHALEELQKQAAILEVLRQEALQHEARFKGAVEGLGGSEWRWDGEHVFIEGQRKKGVRRREMMSDSASSTVQSPDGAVLGES